MALQCGKAGEWQRGKAIMVEMKADGISPNVFSFGSLINACGKVRMGRDGTGWIKEIMVNGGWLHGPFLVY